MKPIIDLHCHTIASGHAYSTVSENINIAIDRGLKFLGISDHACSMPGGPHAYYFYNMHVFPRKVEELKILRGVEANILDYKGSIDLDEEMIKKVDYAIASLHPPCIKYSTKEENTNAVLKAMEHPCVKIIGHPDDSRYELDYERVVIGAKKNNVLLEINNSSLSPNSFRQGARENIKAMLKLCKEHNVMVIMGSDSHICYSIGKFENSIEAINEADFPTELVINYHEDKIIEFFNISF